MRSSLVERGVFVGAGNEFATSLEDMRREHRTAGEDQVARDVEQRLECGGELVDLAPGAVGEAASLPGSWCASRG